MASLFEEMGGTYTLGADGMYYPDLELPKEEGRYHYADHKTNQSLIWEVTKNHDETQRMRQCSNFRALLCYLYFSQGPNDSLLISV